MFRFESPQLLWFLLTIPLWWLLAWGTGRLAARRLAKAFGSRLTPFLSRSVSPRKRFWKWALRSAALACFIVAAARPQMGDSRQEIRSEGVEIILAVDVSESMMAEDVKPNRLEQVKVELGRFVDLSPGHRIGLIAFAGSASLLSPLTSDPAAIRMYLDSLSTLAVSTQGTCFECALKAAQSAFERGGVGTDDQVRVSRVVIVASDGEDHEPGATTAAEELVKKGITVFTMAYGTEKGAPIPVRDGMGYLRSYKKGADGQTVQTTVKGDALQALAKAGGGEFFFAAFGGDHLKELARALDGLEKAQFESKVATQYDERFQIVLLIGILLALLDLLVGERRANFRLWKGRFEVPPA